MYIVHIISAVTGALSNYITCDVTIQFSGGFLAVAFILKQKTRPEKNRGVSGTVLCIESSIHFQTVIRQH